MAFASMRVTGKSGGNFKPVSAGVHIAFCTQVIDLGVQPGRDYGDKRKVYIRFEIPGERVKYRKDDVEVEGPATIGQDFGYSIGEKSKLGPFLESWRGKSFTAEERAGGFDLSSIVGKVCQIGVAHKTVGDKTYGNITSIFGISESQKAEIKAGRVPAKAEGELLVYSTDAPDKETFDKLPNWLKEKIGNAVKPKEVAATEEEFDDDIPF